MREDARQRAAEFVKELYAAGEIDAGRLDTGIAGVLAARSEADQAEAARSRPAPVALTSQGRRLARPLEIHTGLGWLRQHHDHRATAPGRAGDPPRGGVGSQPDPPVPGLPLVRPDVTTYIGRVHLRHPGIQDRTRRISHRAEVSVSDDWRVNRCEPRQRRVR
jgi:hypothetical protein